MLAKVLSSDLANIQGMNELQLRIAPTFLDAKAIMNETSVIPLTLNIFAACFCMGCSALYHLFMIKNPSVHANLARLDYAGISVLIFGSAVPVASYGFACESV